MGLFDFLTASFEQCYHSCLTHVSSTCTHEKMTDYTAREDIQNLKGTFEKKIYDVRSLAPLSAAITQKVAMLWSDASKG